MGGRFAKLAAMNLKNSVFTGLLASSLLLPNANADERRPLAQVVSDPADASVGQYQFDEAGMAWALAHPREGIVETDEMDHDFCLRIQRPYLGRIEAHYTDWTPIATRWRQFEEEIDESDPWQFKNVLAT